MRTLLDAAESPVDEVNEAHKVEDELDDADVLLARYLPEDLCHIHLVLITQVGAHIPGHQHQHNYA